MSLPGGQRARDCRSGGPVIPGRGRLVPFESLWTRLHSKRHSLTLACDIGPHALVARPRLRRGRRRLPTFDGPSTPPRPPPSTEAPPQRSWPPHPRRPRWPRSVAMERILEIYHFLFCLIERNFVYTFFSSEQRACEVGDDESAGFDRESGQRWKADEYGEQVRGLLEAGVPDGKGRGRRPAVRPSLRLLVSPSPRPARLAPALWRARC